MSRQITQPVNQVRLTNVAIVRLNRNGHRFEVACYRNKIINYRQGTETDLSEVLQTERVFANVGRGEFANARVLRECLGTSDESEACKIVLDSGEMQVSDMERGARLESTAREVAGMVSERCVHPVSRRPYTASQVRDAMRAAGFMVHPTRGAKQQFLDCVKLLRRTGALELERAKMELVMVLIEDDDDGDGDGGNGGVGGDDRATRRGAAIEMLTNAGVAASDILPPPNDDGDRCSRVVFRSDPSLYRKMEEIARDASIRGRLEILRQVVTEEWSTLGGEPSDRHGDGPDDEEHRPPRIRYESLADEFKTILAIAEDRANSSDDDDAGGRHRDPLVATTTPAANDAPASRKKAQRAAQKKSKKAKRREREEDAERGLRVEAERERQRERAERLGIAAATDGGDGGAACPSVPTSADGEGGAGGGMPPPPRGGSGDVRPCNTCGGAFTPGEYRLHFRSDWHGYNAKLKMRGVPPVSEKEFLLCDSDVFLSK
jgi:ribosome maturation protein SDO1